MRLRAPADRAGAAALKVFLNFGEPIPSDRLAHFDRLRDDYRRPDAPEPGPGRASDPSGPDPMLALRLR